LNYIFVFREVEHDKAAAFAVENKLMFFETSARSAKNVEEIYLAVAKKLKQVKQAKVVIDDIKKEKKGCC